MLSGLGLPSAEAAGQSLTFRIDLPQPWGLLPDTSTSVDASRPPSGPALVKRADCYLPGEPED